MKTALLIALLGHVLCGVTDCLMAYTPNGRFVFSDVKDSDKMAGVFEGMPLRRLEVAIVLGAIALLMSSFGFAALGLWMRRFSPAVGTLMSACGLAFVISITAHHVCCGATEWFYVRMGRTDDALAAVTDFFKRTSVTMIVGYAALLIFAVVFFVMVVTGRTDLPRWACVFNTLPVYLAISPTKLPAKGNIANAVMFGGLVFFL